MMTIMALVAVTLLSFHPTAYAGAPRDLAVAVSVDHADTQTHEQPSHATGMEEHSHPQVVMPAIAEARRSFQPEKWPIVDQFASGESKVRQHRPPKISVL